MNNKKKVQLHSLDDGVRFSIEHDGEEFYYVKGDYCYQGCFSCVGQWGCDIDIDGRTWVTV